MSTFPALGCPSITVLSNGEGSCCAHVNRTRSSTPAALGVFQLLTSLRLRFETHCVNYMRQLPPATTTGSVNFILLVKPSDHLNLNVKKCNDSNLILIGSLNGLPNNHGVRN